jgi:hypothetical protein
LNLWERYPTLEQAIAALPQGLKDLLPRHEGARLCSEWLKQHHSTEDFRDSAGEAVFNWDIAGMWFGSQNRLHEALSVHSELYSLMCQAQSGYGWIHKGHALVRLRDWHRLLGHPWHEERYLLLTLIEDAIRAEGSIVPEKTGVYYRFRWEQGRSDAEFAEIADRSWKTFSDNPDLHEFPEEILGRLGSDVSKRAAGYSEADLYEINVEYASALYRRAGQKDWRALERLASYELSCIPGFGVDPQKQSAASVFDVLIRLRGQYVDFRRELGAYLIGECKDWEAPVGTESIAYLAQNLTFHECTAGVLFSWSGISGSKDMKFAALTVLRAFHRGGKFILVLDRDDFGKAADGKPLQELLRERYEQVRFDIR